MEAFLLFLAIIVLLLIGVPIAVALGVSSILFLLILSLAACAKAPLGTSASLASRTTVADEAVVTTSLGTREWGWNERFQFDICF